jgi:glycosyltransferase involved in cell wall biosynthesis
VRELLRRLKDYPLGILLSDVLNFVRTIPQEMRSLERRIYCCEPNRQPIGRVLVCYANMAFFLKKGQPIPHDHTNRWESWQIVQTFLDLGYRVDVINENNNRFVPTRDYAIFVGNRTNFDRIAALLNEDCLRILHIDTCHWLFHNLAELRRLEALQQRRGFVLPAQRTMSPNLAIEHADYGITVGNAATMATYAYAKKPLFRVAISNPATYPWSADKDFNAVRKRFVWLGSHGFVHKGLDLVLEAFAQMPDYELTVCGPLDALAERPFQRAYRRELYETPNIHALGWMDVTGPDFLELARTSLGVVFPSASESGSGGVISCMHAGMIPIVTCEAAVDVDETHGVMLETGSIQQIQDAVRELSMRSAEELTAMARRNWERARARHTREVFASTYSQVIAEILGQEGKTRGTVADTAVRRTVRSRETSSRFGSAV